MSNDRPTIVLLGAGHAHLGVIDDWLKHGPPHARTILVEPRDAMQYSGMVPGWMAGEYRGEETLIALAPLVRAAGAALAALTMPTVTGFILAWAAAEVAVAVALFAFSTLITWSYYTLKAWTTLVGRSKGKENAFKLIFCVFTALGAVVNLGSVLSFADGMLFVCAIFNLLGCYLLLPKVKEEVRKWREGRASGEITEVPRDERATT